jgi:hypothetical protein
MMAHASGRLAAIAESCPDVFNSAFAGPSRPWPRQPLPPMTACCLLQHLRSPTPACRRLRQDRAGRAACAGRPRRPFHAGDYIFRAGDPFDDRRGARGMVKTFVDDSQGNEQVLGFSLPGE